MITIYTQLSEAIEVAAANGDVVVERLPSGPISDTSGAAALLGPEITSADHRYLVLTEQDYERRRNDSSLRLVFPYGAAVAEAIVACDDMLTDATEDYEPYVQWFVVARSGVMTEVWRWEDGTHYSAATFAELHTELERTMKDLGLL